MPYQSLTLHVFSGTGNSLRAAHWAAERANASGLPACVRPVEEGPPHSSPTGPEQLVGLLLPTHGFTAPWAMTRHALRLPRGHGAHAFVCATRAGVKLGPLFVPGMEGTAGYLLALVLWAKGYRVRGVTGLDMPSNWTALHSAQKPESVAAIIERAKPVADRFFSTIIGGGRRFRGFGCLLLGLALAPLSAAYLLAGRFLLAKLFFANRRCNGCGLCAQRCPIGAVRMWRGRPYWRFSCESCMRCMGFCPHRAVEVGQAWGAVLWMLGSASFSAWLFGRFAPGVPLLETIDSAPLRAVLDYACMLLTFLVGYLGFWSLARIPAFNALFTWTTLTRLYRRYREPGTKPSSLHGRPAARPPAERPE